MTDDCVRSVCLSVCVCWANGCHQYIISLTGVAWYTHLSPALSVGSLFLVHVRPVFLPGVHAVFMLILMS